MTSTHSAAQAAGETSVRTVNVLRGASMGALVMLIVQYALGIGVNLFVTPARGGIGQAFANGPLLALHAVMAVLLLVTAVSLVVRAIVARHTTVVVTSVIGLAAIVGAAVNGVSFLNGGGNGPSMGMAMSTAVAMICYAVSLCVVGAPRRQVRRGADDRV